MNMDTGNLHSPPTATEISTILAKTAGNLVPSELKALIDALNRRAYNRPESGEDTLSTIFA